MSEADSTVGPMGPPEAPATPAPPATAIPRPSGIRPPTKIGRICCTPKPPVPASPKSNGSSYDSSRKYSDEYSRKHLADVQEADEDGDGPLGILPYYGERSSSTRERIPSTCSTYSMTSMDALWEHHPRRLSEAGLRRTSDHSVVLTEDTDSFIIGDRVWVGGSKAGQIAYIGDTQFAPGEWAGVVLDEAIGKNDGSVAGIRYFQCEARRGVFSRLTRLTREPLFAPSPASPSSENGSTAGSTAGSISGSIITKTTTNGTRTSPGPRASASPGPRTPMSPRNKIPRSSSPNGSMRSFSSKMSTSTISTAELRIGERVIVQSSLGSKAGTLKFKGPTDFASGIWCGVELDDPIGKNDGSVEGKRYFECGPRFGLFAPLSKTTRSPSSRRPGACAVHGSPPESLMSMSTVGSVSGRPRLGVTSLVGGAQRLSGPRVTSTPISAKGTLQELLREKQQHIERLIKEQEVERGELAKISLQVDRTENALAASKKENVQQVKDLEALKLECEKLSQQLEDEKQKVEDLLFRTEEDNIHKEDFGKFKDELSEEKAKLTSKVGELEKELIHFKRQAEELHAQCVLSDAQHKAENEIITIQHKDEVQAAQALATELQKLLDEAHSLLREKDNDKESLGKNYTEELGRHKIETDKIISELKSNLSELQLESSAQITSLSENLKEAEKKLTAQNEKIERSILDNNSMVGDLRNQLEHKQVQLDLITQENHQANSALKDYELMHKKVVDKLKMELSSKTLDYETVCDQSKQLETKCKDIQSELDTLKSELVAKGSELENVSSSASKQNELIQNEIKQLKENLQQKQTELELVNTKAKEDQTSLQQQIKEKSEILQKTNEEVSKLHLQIENLKQDHSKQENNSKEKYTKDIQEKESNLATLLKQLEDKTSSLEAANKENNNMTGQVNDNISEMKKISEVNSQHEAKINDLTKSCTDTSAALSAIQLENGDLQRQLRDETEKKNELQHQKEQLENEIASLSTHTTDSNEQLSILKNKLKEAEKEMLNIKDTNREKVNLCERNEQELKQQLEQTKNLNEEDKKALNQTIKETTDLLQQNEEKLKHGDQKIIDLEKKYEETVSELNSKHKTQISELLQQMEAKQAEELQLKKQMEELDQKSERTISDLNKRLESIQEHGQTSESKLKEKLDQMVTAQNELNVKLETAQKCESELREIHQKTCSEFENEKQSLVSQMKQKDEQVNNVNQELKKLQTTCDGSQNTINEKEKSAKELQLKISAADIELKSNVETVAEKERQINSYQEEIKKVLDEKHEMEKKYNVTVSECETLGQKINNLTEGNFSSESTLKDQQITINKLKEQIEKILLEKKESESLVQTSLADLNKEKLTSETLTAKISEYNKKIGEMEIELSKKDSLVKNLETDTKTIKTLQESKDLLKVEVQQHISELDNKNLLILQLNESIALLQKGAATSSDNEQKLSCLDKEIVAIKTSHLQEINEFKKTIQNLEKEKVESEKKSTLIDEATKKILELNSVIEKSEVDIQKLNTINEAQKKNYEDLNKQLQADFDNLKSESKKDRKQFKGQLQSYESQVSENNKQLETEQSQLKELLSKLEVSTNSVKALQDKVKYLEASSAQKSGEEQSELQKTILELQEVQRTSHEESKKFNSEITNLTEQMAKKNSDTTKYCKQISTLENDLKSYKTVNDTLKQDIFLLSNELKILKNTEVITKQIGDAPQNTPAPNIPTNDTKRLIEEKEEVEGQVSFLNSVIVDMQKKNEELKARVEVLEMGCTPQEADEYNLNGLKSKMIAPRMFCDICDVFDAHETEDCPRQANDGDSVQQGTKKNPPPPREYCDICETFGHATEDCDDEETY